MTINHTTEGDHLTLALEGRLDTMTAPEFQEKVLELLPGIKAVDIDLAGVDYVSSAGLRALLFLQKACGRTDAQMTVHNVTPAVLDVFEMTGFDKMLHLA